MLGLIVRALQFGHVLHGSLATPAKGTTHSNTSTKRYFIGTSLNKSVTPF